MAGPCCALRVMPKVQTKRGCVRTGSNERINTYDIESTINCNYIYCRPGIGVCGYRCVRRWKLIAVVFPTEHFLKQTTRGTTCFVDHSSRNGVLPPFIWKRGFPLPLRNNGITTKLRQSSGIVKLCLSVDTWKDPGPKVNIDLSENLSFKWKFECQTVAYSLKRLSYKCTVLLIKDGMFITQHNLFQRCRFSTFYSILKKKKESPKSKT